MSSYYNPYVLGRINPFFVSRDVDASTENLINPNTRLNILFVASEAHPLVKTGGLADVAGSLPVALRARGHDVRLVLPAYAPALERISQIQKVAELRLAEHPDPIVLHQARLPDSDVVVYLVASSPHFNRPGGPYTDEEGHTWPDNAARFALFCRIVTEIAMNRVGLGWKPHMVHANDWQTGLVPAFLAREIERPGTLFTIHNLAYQGLFAPDAVHNLGLPNDWWHASAMEFHGHFSFIKGGLVFADWLNTVSPTYAQEIRTSRFGFGLEGLLEQRAGQLSGILNGADYRVWDPQHDPHIEQRYSLDNLDAKMANKLALQTRFGLQADERTPVIGLICRLVAQKGIDLALAALPRLLQLENLQFAVLGYGEKHFENALRDLATQYPSKMGLEIGFSEALAHKIEAGADMFLMPSRFEPCGLNQIYSLRYGTVPIVHATGGLADTIVDATPENLLRGTATGFTFRPATPESLVETLQRALKLYRNPGSWWRRLMETGMQQDFSWALSAMHYESLYSHIHPPKHDPTARIARAQSDAGHATI
jgi:starch synthase